MTHKQLCEILNTTPQTPEGIVIKAYQLGRYFGQHEATRHTDPVSYDDLCNYVAEATTSLINELRLVWGEALQPEVALT